MTAAPSRERIEFLLQRIACLRDPFQNPEALREIQHFIEEDFRQSGYTVTHQPFEFQGARFENVLARLSDFDPAKPRFIVGAHFDAVPGTPGADDNASGVAAMLEAARVLCGNPRGQSLGPVPYSSAEPAPCCVEFAAFNLEEYGMAGSSAYAAELKKSGVKVAGMISLEMVGYTDSRKGSQQIPLPLRAFYPDTGNFLALVGDGNSKKLLKHAAKAFRGQILEPVLNSSADLPALRVETLTVPFKGKILPEVRLSDHSPFWDAGFPALLVTDTSFFRNPHYHTADDAIATLDLDFLLKVTEGVVRFAKVLGDRFCGLSPRSF